LLTRGEKRKKKRRKWDQVEAQRRALFNSSARDAIGEAVLSNILMFLFFVRKRRGGGKKNVKI